ncbi:universal stress protein [Archaeoglobus profundus]|uniref:UspA domain protein n=1 Tax=Archaeoglobus profundus (strain DSM 5631 / JCM 9629 / NBRC 100127 / Av18) TaxID=572546 RepID=D2REN4_ARCPA|nr:universal stress protein [Archaeoglobus profundus]ADB58578.1 UspA domain protein [Archaeoglobus profundus DSM 5631]
MIDEVLIVRVININRVLETLIDRESWIEKEKMASLEKFEEHESFFKLNDIKCRSILRVGDPAEEIVGVANEEGANLIAMGHRGRSFLKKILLGSVAEGVVRLSKILVLVVKGGIEIFRTVLYVHYPLESDPPEFLKEIPYERLYIMHVVEPMLPPESTTHLVRERVDEAKKRLEEIAKDLNGEVIVKVGGVAKMIIKTATELRVGCIVLKTRKFTRVTDDVLRYAKKSVLVIKES